MFVSRRIFTLSALGMVCTIAHAAPAGPLLTILDRDAFLLRDDARLALAEGVALRPDDILEVPAQGKLARLEYADGLSLALGPGSRALLAPRLKGDRGGARTYLLAGWVKLSAPKGVAASVLSPALDVATTGGTIVLAVRPEAAQVFAENGEAAVRRPGNAGAVQVVKTGELLGLAATAGAQPELANRPTQAFVSTLPRAFMDALPPRAARFQGKEVEPQKIGPLSYADAQPWLDAESVALRRANLPRWRPLLRDAEFRRGLAAGLKAHPEWDPILNPPPPKPAYR
ncbi:hypothetical protein GT347_24825 [Xylophilus rhododendri]|uniref:FecR protein domain-containing protein n=1 Tax=Xylophilus rhododendri TaxID=2697032 RepID=A0A857JDT1_9BURK|nr:hypothetical protein [Xylophilus rhododendri]QHJ00929.1 hypothetical protein GT347_24825 [Xylophilus rhododendri]